MALEEWAPGRWEEEAVQEVHIGPSAVDAIEGGWWSHRKEDVLWSCYGRHSHSGGSRGR